jgi:hypothetical protein
MPNRKGLGIAQKEVLAILRKHPGGLSKYKICQLQIQSWIGKIEDHQMDSTKFRPTFHVSYNTYFVLKSLESRGLVVQGSFSKKWCLNTGVGVDSDNSRTG